MYKLGAETPLILILRFGFVLEMIEGDNGILKRQVLISPKQVVTTALQEKQKAKYWFVCLLTISDFKTLEL